MKQGELHGVIAQFDDADALVAAVHRARESGYTQMDAYSPFPIEALPEGLGLTRSPLPQLALLGGLLGAAAAFGLMWYSAVIDYPWNIGGRPQNSWPSFIPITFEIGVLSAALFIFIGVMMLCGMPRPHRPVFGAPGFERASRDRFFLLIAADDSKFDVAETQSFLSSLRAEHVSEVRR